MRVAADEVLHGLQLEVEPFHVAVQHDERVLRHDPGDLVEDLGAVRVAFENDGVRSVAEPPTKRLSAAGIKVGEHVAVERVLDRERLERRPGDEVSRVSDVELARPGEQLDPPELPLPAHRRPDDARVAPRRRSLRRGVQADRTRKQETGLVLRERALQSRSGRDGSDRVAGTLRPRKDSSVPMSETAPGAASSTALGCGELLRRSRRADSRGTRPVNPASDGNEGGSDGCLAVRCCAAKDDASRSDRASGRTKDPPGAAGFRAGATGLEPANRRRNRPAVSATASAGGEDLPMQAVQTACTLAQGRSAPCTGSAGLLPNSLPTRRRGHFPDHRGAAENLALSRHFFDAPGMNRTCARGLGNRWRWSGWGGAF